MSGILSKDEINEYLQKIKDAVASGRFRFIGRKKNIESLAVAGILPSHVKKYILQLTYTDYFGGPEEEQDDNFAAGSILFFGADIEGYEFYIKVKIESRTGEDYVVCLSFHIAERPIHYPYK